ncbi:hypothetical protein [Dactylosporangium sp. NPDC049140]|uniref:hypothetical protein n=1 Tax=Dactylosporangium sp. NPDC049140 TaxID=3155647 RepID=UPI0033E9D29A
MDTDGTEVQAGSGYPAGRLARAFVTAVTDADPDVRARAERRAEQWAAVLDGMASGRLSIGSRTPVRGLPAWVTPEVVRGGFATGTPAAGGPLRAYESELAHEAGVPAGRGALFAWLLGEDGSAALGALLDGGAYRVELAEQAALLVVAWLLRAGNPGAALDLLDEIAPFADRLSFAPVPDAATARDWSVVWRETAGAAGAALGRRRENERVAAMREALTVWNPLADEFLQLWLDPGAAGWRERAAELLARYERLAAGHTRCGKHRRPGENLAVLRAATEEALGPGPRTVGLLRHTVDSMVARRGLPGSPRHAALRADQARNAARPTHHRLARVVVARVAALDPDAGITDVDAVCAPVSAAEAVAHGVPVGAVVPDAVRRVVRRACAGTVAELIGAGVVPSAEVLADLVPQLSAMTSAAAYPDPALRTLMAATYRAFRRRRSLLLLDLRHQVRLEELPWVRALAPYRQATAGSRGEARATLGRLAELALDGFPATLLPNPLVAELAALGGEAGEDLPWVEELAADIFMGRFSPKFLRAAQLAGRVLAGGLYARYYDIDYDDLPGDAEAFGALCRRRAHRTAGAANGGSRVAANGMVIEQAQILTTHNLATLAGALGVTPPDGWPALTRRTFTTVVRLTGRLGTSRRPQSTVKDIAYAWRHLVCYLSLPGAGDPAPVIEALAAELAAAPRPVRARLTPVLTGLAEVAAGASLTSGRRLQGWTTGRHWLLA